jgi:hypothetical protein
MGFKTGFSDTIQQGLGSLISSPIAYCKWLLGAHKKAIYIYISFKVVIEQKRLSQIKSTLELTALNYNDWFTA